MNQPKKRALGRGLSAILSERISETNITTSPQGSMEHFMEIPLEKIAANPYQPRTRFDQERLQELSASIRALGVIQPITVRRESNNFQLISGERRYHACKLADLTSVPAFIRSANDTEMLEMALVENIQRHDLDAIEIALSYQRLIQEIQLTQEELSRRVGKKRSTIANQLRLLELPPIIQAGIRDGMISMGHGRALINIEDNDYQLSLYEKIIRKALSVRQTEKLAKQHKNTEDQEKKAPNKSLPNPFKKAAKSISEHLKSPVDIQRDSTGKGKIIIPFNSDEDFERIKEVLL